MIFVLCSVFGVLCSGFCYVFYVLYSEFFLLCSVSFSVFLSFSVFCDTYFAFYFLCSVLHPIMCPGLCPVMGSLLKKKFFQDLIYRTPVVQDTCSVFCVVCSVL